MSIRISPRNWVLGRGGPPASRIYTVSRNGKIELCRIRGEKIFLYALGVNRGKVVAAFLQINGQKIVRVQALDGKLINQYRIEQKMSGTIQAIPEHLTKRQISNRHGESIRNWLLGSASSPEDKQVKIYKATGMIKLCNIGGQAVFLSGFTRRGGQEVTLHFESQGEKRIIFVFEPLQNKLIGQFQVMHSHEKWKAISVLERPARYAPLPRMDVPLADFNSLSPSADEFGNNSAMREAILDGCELFLADLARPIFKYNNFRADKFLQAVFIASINGKNKAFTGGQFISARGVDPADLRLVRQCVKNILFPVKKAQARRRLRIDLPRPSQLEFDNDELMRLAISDLIMQKGYPSQESEYRELVRQPIYFESDKQAKVFFLNSLLRARGLPGNLYGAQKLIKMLGSN